MSPGARLEHLLRVLGSAGVLADIGTDHARLPIAAVRRGRVRAAIATDLRAGPLAAARAAVEAAGLAGRVQLRQGYGLRPLAPGEADAIAIAGLHGATIAAILTDRPQVLVPGTRLLLMPARAAGALRSCLRAWGEAAAVPPGDGPAAGGPGSPPACPLPGRPSCSGQRRPPAAGLASRGPASPPSPPPGEEGGGVVPSAPPGPRRSPVPRGPALALRSESLVREGRHVYVLMDLVTVTAVPGPGGDERALDAPFRGDAGSPAGEPRFAPAGRWQPRAVEEAARELAGLAARRGLDPDTAVDAVGPALLAGAGGRPDPLLVAWLAELARPWRRAVRSNKGSSDRARQARRQAEQWLDFLDEVGRRWCREPRLP